MDTYNNKSYLEKLLTEPVIKSLTAKPQPTDSYLDQFAQPQARVLSGENIGFFQAARQAFAHSIATGPSAALLKLAGSDIRVPEDVPGLFTPEAGGVPLAARAGATLGALTGAIVDPIGLFAAAVVPGVGTALAKSVPALSKAAGFVGSAATGAGLALGYNSAYIYNTEDRLPTPGEALFSAALGAGLGALPPLIRAARSKKLLNESAALREQMFKDFELPADVSKPIVIGKEERILSNRITSGRLEEVASATPYITNALVWTEKRLASLQEQLDDLTPLKQKVYRRNVKNYNKFVNEVVQLNPELKKTYDAVQRLKNTEIEGIPVFDKIFSGTTLKVNPIIAAELIKEPATAFPTVGQRLMTPFDPKRMAERFDGTPNGVLNREVIAPIVQMEDTIATRKTNIITPLQKYADENPNIVKNLNDNKMTVYKYMSGKMKAKEALSQGLTPESIKFLHVLERISNAELRSLNKQLKANNLPKVDLRKFYIPFLWQKNWPELFAEGLSNMYGGGAVFQSAGKRSKIHRSFMLERTTETPIEKNLLNPVESYLSHISSVIDATERLKTIPRLHDKVAFIEPNYRQWFTTFLNRLIGEKPALEQWLYTQGASALLDAGEKISNAAATNLIFGNMRIAVQQFSQILPTIANVGFRNWLKGTYAQFFRGGIEPFVNKSLILKQRLSEPLDIQQGWFEKFTSYGTYIIRKFDRFNVTNTFLAAYHAAKSHGASDIAAIKAAETATTKIQAVYSSVFRPLFLSSDLGRTFMPLSTFMFNQWNMLMNSGDAKFFAALNNRAVASQYAHLLAAVWGTNLMYEKLIGIENPHPMFTDIKGVGIPSHPLIATSFRGMPGLVPGAFKRGLDLIQDGTYFNIWHDDPDVRANAMWRVLNVAAIAAPGGPQLVRTLETAMRVDSDRILDLGRQGVYELTPKQAWLSLVLGWRYVSPMKDIAEYKKMKRAGMGEEMIEKIKRFAGEEMYD